MRWLIVLTALSGCDAPNLLKVQATIRVSTRGVVLHPDGQTGRLGAMGETWAFQARTGLLTGPSDAAGLEDDVQDVGISLLGSRSVVIVGDGEVVIADGRNDLYTRHVDVRALQARLWSGGLVVLAPDCQLAWMDLDGVVSAAAPGACVAGEVFAVDAETGRVAFADGDDIELADRTGEIVIDVPATAIARDRGGWVVTSGRDVTALDFDGDPRWTVDLGADVAAIGAARDTGLIVASVELGQPGELVLLDGASGDIVSQQVTPTSAQALSVSADGSAFAMILPDTVYVVSVRQ